MRIKKIFCGSVGTSRCSVKWFVGRSSNRRTANKNTPPDYWNVFFFLSCCLFYVYFNSTYHLDIFLYLYVLTETVLFTLFLQQVSESFFKQDVWNIRLCDSLYEKKKIPVWKRISLCVSTTYLANVMQFVSFRYKPLFLLFVQND